MLVLSLVQKKKKTKNNTLPFSCLNSCGASEINIDIYIYIYLYYW